MTTSQSPQQGHKTSPADPFRPDTGPQPQYRYGGAPQHGAPRHAAPQGAPYAAPQGAIPAQWAPPSAGAFQPAGYPLTAQQPAGWGRIPAQAPRNGLGIAALCLGVVGILFGMVPFTGFIAFAVGAVGVILGLVGLGRARKMVATNLKTAISGTVLSVIAVVLGIWGMVIVFTGLNQLAQDLNEIPTASAPAVTAPAGTVPADVVTPYVAGPAGYQLEITGDAEKMMVGYGTGNSSSSSSDYQALPWSKTVETTGDYPMASVNASSFGPGSLTCTITDVATGAVVDTETASSPDSSEYSSASVYCSTMG